MKLILLQAFACLLVCCAITPVRADSSVDEFLSFIRNQAAAMRSNDKPPASLAAWTRQNARLRAELQKAWGPFPATPAPLSARKLGELQRDGYRVQKLVFQTLPGVWMTANAYVPNRSGKLPAILMVHGHWRGAKQDPVVQARCIGAARLGFFVLAVDALGAGERAVGKALGEYHGEMTAATLLPVGCPLSGLQVYENMRAVDYLCSRPEVDSARIGITGASGGGNQTMYSGAWDERFAAAVPVCSVGNYQAYLGAACCMCEVVPGALRFTEEWGVLGLTAPRGLMVVNASRDAVQFSVAESNKSLAAAEPIFELFGKADHLKHVTFESGHDYSRPMREAMYGWMTLHLKGEGDGSPIPEPAMQLEDPETLRCFPGNSRPDDWMTIPKYAAARAREMIKSKPRCSSPDDWRKEAAKLRKSLSERVLGGVPKLNGRPPTAERVGAGDVMLLHFEPEPGIHLTGHINGGTDKKQPVAIVLDLEGEDSPATRAFIEELRRTGRTTVSLDLRATGKLAYKQDAVGSAPDHTTAEWSLWIGRPLLGQWVLDVRRLLDALASTGMANGNDIAVIAIGPAGMVALSAAALDKRITRVATVGTLASYVTEEPYRGQRLGIMAPGVLREVGDVAHLASLMAPRRLVVAGGVTGDGKALDASDLKEQYAPAARIWSLMSAPDELVIGADTDSATVVRALR